MVQSGSLLHPLCIARRDFSPKANDTAEEESLGISRGPRPPRAPGRTTHSSAPASVIDRENRPANAGFASKLREKNDGFLASRDFSHSARSPTILPIHRRASLHTVFASGRAGGTERWFFRDRYQWAPPHKPVEIPGRFCNKGVSHDPYSS